MKKVFSVALASIAMLASTAACVGCTWLFMDEPQSPKFMD